MIPGLSQKEFEFLMHAFEPLMTAGARLYLFGSRARGSQQKFSDIDVLIEPETVSRAQISEISDSLEQSNFPYKVDMVMISELAEAYKSSVLNDRILLQPLERK